MNKTVVLVMLSPEDPDADAFRKAVYQQPALTDRIDLRIAKDDAAKQAIIDAEVVVCGNISPELLASAARLRWVSFWSAGMDGKVTPDLRARDLMLTNASGVHGPNIAEHILGFMLMFTRRLDFHFRAQLAGKWERQLPEKRSGADELTGQTLGIVGLGRIGEALASRAKAFGMRVVAVKRDPQVRHDNAPLDGLYGMNELPRLLGESDHICIALPHTRETYHLFDAEMLAHCRPSAYLYNIARGKIVDEPALVEALRSGRLAGAGLDVFEQEPLPPDSALWTLPNVLITPHTAGITPYYFPRAAALFAENLNRYLRSEPLNNLYKPDRGY